MGRRPEGAHRCGAWTECAYWAFSKYVSPDGKKEMWICANCARLYKLDGWTRIPKETPCTS